MYTQYTRLTMIIRSDLTRLTVKKKWLWMKNVRNTQYYTFKLKSSIQYAKFHGE